jgi:transcriptional regulator with XRE-family HTH domain
MPRMVIQLLSFEFIRKVRRKSKKELTNWRKRESGNMSNDLDQLDEWAESVPSIDIGLPQKLKDHEYRKGYFLAEASARIAEQLTALRKRRQLNQKQVAELVGTHQPAISRAEKADYHSWSFNTLRGIADALDARIRVIIEPSEDVLHEYEDKADDDVLNGDAVKAAEEASKKLGQAPLTPQRDNQQKPQPSLQ